MKRVLVVISVLGALTAGFFGYCYCVRETEEKRQAARKTVDEAIQKLSPEEAVPYLRKLLSETSFKTSFDEDNFYIGFRPAVPHDYIAELTMNQLNSRTLKLQPLHDLLVFTNDLLGSGDLSAKTTESLRMKARTTAARVCRTKIRKELAETAPEGVSAYLKELLEKILARPAIDKKLVGVNIPIDFLSPDDVGDLTEDAFLRFAGNGTSVAPDIVRLKQLLTFSEDLLKREILTQEAAKGLRERRLDGFFLAQDFDGALAVLDQGGLRDHSEGWCRGTAAKLRFHKAEAAKDYPTAISQLLVFINFMLSDEQKDFEDRDPTTGIFYSRDWVVAINFVRCANMSKTLGKKDDFTLFAEKAKKHYAIALEKAKDDKTAQELIQKEIKSAGL